MKAIVMAGGEGTRLRPLTAGRPKPMVELFDRPVIEHTVALLRKNGITDICFTLGYLPGVIEEYFGDGDGFGVNIESRVEKTPLGTAGGVRACSDFIGEDDVLIISGDAVCDFDLKGCADTFREKKCDALLVLYEHPDPTEYGLVVTDGDGRIERFVEKPDWGSVVTNRINTGIYFLTADTVKLIPEKGMYDFGKDLFPRMLKEGKRLYGICADGYWCDVGSPEEYRRCCGDILGGKTSVDTGAPMKKKGIWSNTDLPHGCELIPPVYIGKNCVIGKKARIGPETVLGDNSSVGTGAIVDRSVVNGAVIGENASVTGSVIGGGTTVGKKTEILSDCVIGDRCAIGDGCFIESGIKIWPGREVWGGSRVMESITEASPVNSLKFGTDHTIRGKMPFPLTPEMIFAAGAALGKEGSVGVSFIGSEAASVLGESAACGARGAGADVFLLDCSFEAEAAFAAELYGIDNSIFIRQKGSEAVISFFSKGGVRAERGIERKVEGALRGEHPRANAGAYGSRLNTEGTSRAYIAAAVKRAWEGRKLPAGFKISVTGHGAENRALRTALTLFGAELTERKNEVPLFECEEGGQSLYAQDERGSSIMRDKLLLLTAEAAFAKGERRIAAEYDAPAALDEIAARYGAEVLRAGRDGEEAGRLLAEQKYMTDGIFACLLICRLMVERNMTLWKLMEEIPRFSTAERRVDIVSGRARVMRELTASCAEMASEMAAGLSLKNEKGCVRIRPCSDGKALRILAEAADEETAEELCADFRRRIDTIS